MFRSYLLMLAALAACYQNPARAQQLRGQSFESRLLVPSMRDPLRLWHRYLTDSTVVILIPQEANPWLRRGYEFVMPIGRISNPVQLAASQDHRDSLTISCTASDYYSSGFRMLFCRERNAFSFRNVTEFQLFRSGVERVCRIPVSTRERPDRRILTPLGGANSCGYIYHRKLIASFPDGVY